MSEPENGSDLVEVKDASVNYRRKREEAMKQKIEEEKKH